MTKRREKLCKKENSVTENVENIKKRHAEKSKIRHRKERKRKREGKHLGR